MNNNVKTVREPLFHIVKRDTIKASKKITIYAIAILASLLLGAIICSLVSTRGDVIKFFSSLFEGCFSTTDKTVNHFCPVEFPTARIASAADNDEILVYLFYYFNLCGAHRNNKELIVKLQNNIRAYTVLAEIDRSKVNSIIDAYFLNNMDSATKTLIEPFISESLQPSAGGIFDRLMNSLQVFLKKIADYFDYLYKIFTGQLDYGEGGSPFI